MRYNLTKQLFCFILIFILFINPVFVFSQTDTDNHRKYWYFKTRLNNDFLKVGRNDGESIPFMQRGVYSNSFSNPSVDMKSGDAAGMLGYYIGVLATEYKLLKINAQSTAKVKHELFCAIEAINRLDYKAEGYYQTGSEQVNGFFVRDDIPKDFIKKNKDYYDHFNYFSDWDGTYQTWGDVVGFNNDRGFCSKLQSGVFKVQSTWQDLKDGGQDNTSFESQDQVYNLLLGLAFVNKYVPITETDGTNTFAYGSGESSLTKEARNITKRLIDHLRNPKDINGNDCLTAANKLINSWRVRNPTTCYLVPTGDDARAFAYPLGEAECLMTNNTLSLPNTFNLTGAPIACPSSGYQNVYSLTVGFPAWNLIAATTQLYLPSSPENGMDTRTFITNMSAICNCVYTKTSDQIVQSIITQLQQSPILSWLGVIIGWIWKIITILLNTFVPGFYTNNTSNAIINNAYPYNAPLDHGPIAHALLHDKLTYLPNPQYTMKYLIDAAPCDNIYNFGSGNQSHFEWSSDSRLDHPNRRGQDAGAGSWQSPKGEYNGIDFLFYHNLYYLHKSALGVFNQNMTDLSDIYINNPININSGNINAYETILTENTTFNYTNPTYWRAGKSITYGPGTTIVGVNNLHAYIQKFDCATDLGQFRLANDSNNVNNGDSYPTAQYHHQNYPKEESPTGTAIVNNDKSSNYIIELPYNDVTDAAPSVNEFALYPNPANSITKAYFNLNEKETAKITVTDIVGKVVIEKENISNSNNSCDLDLKELSNGSYIVNYSKSSGITKSVKLLKVN